mmetsp:Transcript_36130/g.41134  ORF Transcript_36130/g.41134 Transcript_36130/m.41134 type:complete len:243 (-) Transcript_36130:651-1379(-)
MSTVVTMDYHGNLFVIIRFVERGPLPRIFASVCEYDFSPFIVGSLQHSVSDILVWLNTLTKQISTPLLFELNIDGSRSLRFFFVRSLEESHLETFLPPPLSTISISIALGIFQVIEVVGSCIEVAGVFQELNRLVETVLKGVSLDSITHRRSTGVLDTLSHDVSNVEQELSVLQVFCFEHFLNLSFGFRRVVQHEFSKVRNVPDVVSTILRTFEETLPDLAIKLRVVCDGVDNSAGCQRSVN